jgi:hypothetical protein
MARDMTKTHCPVAALAPALALIVKEGGPKARAEVAALIESGLGFSAVNVPKEQAARVSALAFAIGLAGAKKAAPADLDAAPAAFAEAAESVAADMARRSCLAALSESGAFPGPEAGGTACRSYTVDSGLLNCRATFDGDSVVMAWDIEGRPLSRASAESFIAARMASRIGGQS